MTNERVEILCRTAIEKVDEAIAAHEHGEPADLSVPMLQKIRVELEQMIAAQSPKTFRPGFGRFLLEWPDEHGLVRYLMDVGYQYERLR